MNHIYGHPHSKKAEFYKLLLDYDESLERDLADCRAIWYESGTHNLMVGDYGMSDRIVSRIISKEFGFIQRLVKNDKIDFSWEGKLSSDLVDLFERKIDNAEGVIALLSISDTPIEDLISYLNL